MEMNSQKIKFVVDKLIVVMPRRDAPVFQNLMYSYIQQLQNGASTLSAPNTDNSRVNALAAAVLESMLSEDMNPAMGSAKKSVGYRYPQYYWYNPWWWNYWYYSWSPYYWWTWDPNPYDGIRYVGGARKAGECNNGSGILDNVIDSAVDITSMNLVCNDDRLCDFNVRFRKAPLPEQRALNRDVDITVVDESGNLL